jgi:ABC-type nitrate/sulfonate/bicarbonate transport system substrate-binding protein
MAATRRRAVVSTFLTIAFSAAGIGLAAAQGAPAPAAPDKIVWGYTNPSSYYWDVYAAIDLGLTKKQNLDVEAIDTPTSSQGVQLLASSSVNVSSANMEITISAINQGADLAFVAGEVNRASFALLARPDIKTYADLKGKTLGVTQLHEASTTMLELLLAQNGVEKGSYDIIVVGGTPTRFAALKTGQIAATMLSQPVDFEAQAIGMRKLGYAFQAFPGPIIALAVQRTWARAHASTLVRFLRAVNEASDWLADSKNRDQAVAILMKRTHASKQDAEKNYDLWYGPDKIMASKLDLPLNGVEAYLSLNKIKRPPSDFVDMSYAKKALAAAPSR